MKLAAESPVCDDNRLDAAAAEGRDDGPPPSREKGVWLDDEDGVVEDDARSSIRRDKDVARGGMVRFALLALLRESPDYGYQLKRRFDERVGALWDLNIGQVYQTLRALKRLGLVSETVTEGHNRPARRLFALTPEGIAVLERWLHKAPVRPQPLRDETLIQLLVLEPARRADAVARICEQEHLYKLHLSRLRAQKRRLGGEPNRALLVRQLSIEGALLHTEAHLKWLEYCRLRVGEATES